jgi:hypothetical protein
MVDSPESLTFEAQLRVSPEAASWTVFDGDEGQRSVDSPESLTFEAQLRVTGTVDDHAVAITLMPTGNGAHVGPVKAATRKAIGKAAGDRVRVRLEKAGA